MMNGLVKYDDVVKLVRQVCMELLDKCAYHYDEDLQEEVYSDMREVNMLLQWNKKMLNGLNELNDKGCDGVYIEGLSLPTDRPLLLKINPDGSVNSTVYNGYQRYKVYRYEEDGTT